MNDKEIAELWCRLQDARNYAEIYAILKEALEDA